MKNWIRIPHVIDLKIKQLSAADYYRAKKHSKSRERYKISSWSQLGKLAKRPSPGTGICLKLMELYSPIVEGKSCDRVCSVR